MFVDVPVFVEVVVPLVVLDRLLLLLEEPDLLVLVELEPDLLELLLEDPLEDWLEELLPDDELLVDTLAELFASESFLVSTN